ncbi:hypothetical protein [Streptomyces rubiginosohelvolus]|uniref:hypothetical protein n=1 Tax=Streptomyces rubiginosohelvolus TaxID=67362 RepID=UPI0033B87910
MSSADSEQPVHPPIRPRRTVEEPLAAKGAKLIASLDDLTADTFASDEELEEFVAFVTVVAQRAALRTLSASSRA